MKKENLDDLGKARSHFVKAATEWIVGAGFALKGVSGLLKESEGRRLITDFAFRYMGKGAGLAANLSNLLKSFEACKPEKTKSRPKKAGKRTRKVGVE